MNLNEKVRKILHKYGIQPDLELGQHFLIDEKVLQAIALNVPANSFVVEIGAGVGQLTEYLIKKSKKVWAYEIDRKFYPPLRSLGDKNRNLEIVYEDFILADLQSILLFSKKNLILTGSLPYHVTEPFFQKVNRLPIKQLVLLVGIHLHNEILAKPGDPDFGKLGFLINTFYSTKVIEIVPKEAFEPEPPTQSAIIKLTARNKKEFSQDRLLLLQKDLFMSVNRGTKIKNIIKESLIFYDQMKLVRTKSDEKKLTQNEARKIIKKLKITKKILESTFTDLSNDQLTVLLNSLTKLI